MSTPPSNYGAASHAPPTNPDGRASDEQAGAQGDAQRQALLITNNSNARDAAAGFETVLDTFRNHGLRCQVEAASDVEALRHRVRQARQCFDLVVLAGGDGTLHAALPCLRGEGAPLGILPSGTANDFARSLEIPFSINEAARVIATGRIQWIDVGWVNGECFVNVAHLGVGAWARKQLTPERKRRLGVLGYPLALFLTLRNYRPFRLGIDVDGEVTWMHAVHAAVGNGRYFGGGVPVDPTAGLADARLDVHCIRAAGLPTLVRAGAAIWRGDKRPHGVWRASGREVTLSSRRPRRITADGEEVTTTPARFQVEPGVLPVIVPAAGKQR